MNNSKRTLLIEAYLDGKMSDDERSSFEHQVSSDQTIAEDLQLQSEIRSTFEDRECFSLLEKLHDIRQENSKTRIRRKFVTYSSSAAAFIIVLLVSYYFLFYDKYSNEELYQKYYTPAETGIIKRGSDTVTSSDLFTAIYYYEIKKFDLAIKLFSDISPQDPQYHISVYFLALSYMEKGEYNKAIEKFSLTEKNTSSMFYYDALWYKGLCYLKTNERENAVEIFNKLNESDSGFSQKASEIMDNIN